MASRSAFLKRPRIDPTPITGGMSVQELVDGTFLAYNGARLREACQVFTRKMLDKDVTIGLSLTGALTPAGLGIAAVIPLLEAGFIDWIVSTGANLYHDTHYALDLPMHMGQHDADDVALRQEGVVRIYDIFFDFEVLLKTDGFFKRMITAPEFQRPMGTAEFHYLAGGYVKEREKALGIGRRSILSTAHDLGVPIYTSSPGDSSIGLNVAAMSLLGNQLTFDPSIDVNETTAIVYEAKQKGGRSGVVILGGGSPKNFILQTEPQIQEVMGLQEKGHDFFIQMTDARPDTGGLSGATPGEAVSWGKVDPDKLPDTIVCYVDATVALPLLAAYALSAHAPRRPKRLYDRREEMVTALSRAFIEAGGLRTD